MGIGMRGVTLLLRRRPAALPSVVVPSVVVLSGAMLPLAGMLLLLPGPSASAAPRSRVVSVGCGDAGSLDVILATDTPPRPVTTLPAGVRITVGYWLRDRVTGATIAGGLAPAEPAATGCDAVPVSGVRFAAVASTALPAGVGPDDLLDGAVTLTLVTTDDGGQGPFEAGAVPGSGRSFPFAAELSHYLAARPGRASVAVFDATDGQTYSYAPQRSFVTASIVKATILATLERQAQDAGRQLTSTERSLATRMIEVSDNAAASALWNEVGGAAGVGRFITKVPMPSTTPGSGGLWGLTTTNTADQVALVRALAYPSSVLADARRGYELDLMAKVTPSQRWGVSAGPPASAVVQLKNGWLPHGGGWVVNSIGHVAGNGRDYVIAVLSSGSPAFGTGIDTVEGVSRIVWDELAPRRASLFGVLTSGGGSGRVEVHALGPTGYRAFSLHRASVFAAVDPSQWTFLVAPRSGPLGGGIDAGDLVGIRLRGGRSGRVEVHVATAASGYAAFSLHVATALAAVAPAQWQFGLGALGGPGSGLDLVGVRTAGTGSGRVEVHVLTQVSGYRSYRIHAVTPLPADASVAPQWTFLTGGGGDVVGVHHLGTGSRRTEVHVLAAGRRYGAWVLNRTTPLGLTDPVWSFALGDQNGDGAADLVAVRARGGASGHVEVHVLSGAAAFTAWSLHVATPLVATTAAWQWSAG